MEDDYAIGLDLGTTYSCIGVYRNGGVEIIPNSIGEKITPSVVIFDGDDILVGEDTTDILVKHFDNCIYEVKRLIGLDLTKKENEEEIKKLPFKVVKSNNKNTADIEVKIKGEKKYFSPVEISSLIIKKLVHNAETYLKKKIKKLVITVPAYFNEDQKKMTSQAASMLNLDVVKIINEPTAAALAYGFTKEKLDNKKILVFDLGGGTFDISILSFEDDINKDNKGVKNLTVLSTSGDMHLGGEDFDNALVEYIIKKAELPKDIKNDLHAMKKLKVSCENAKKILSSSNQTILRINNICDNKDINERITRKDFEQICQRLFDRLKTPMDTALKNNRLIKTDINEVILIGGSTRIPKIKEFINEYFDKQIKINDSINADEAVAYGATLQAEKILYNRDEIISNFHILDITPFSLGISVINESKDEEIQKEGDEMSVIIKRGAPLPAYGFENYQTVKDGQTRVRLKIYEGEKKYVKYNHLLKDTTIEGLSPKPKGETKILVEFKIDVNGILYIKAVEKSEINGQSISLSIKNDEISFSDEEMKKLREKMGQMSKKIKYIKDFDYTNLKETLKEYKDAYEKCAENEEEDKKLILNNFITTLEEFIDSFDKKFDNETMLEKFFLYIKELFLSYIENFKLSVDKSEKKNIFTNIKKYIQIFIDKSSGYLNNLLEILSPLQNGNARGEFLELIVFIIEKLNMNGKECLQKNREFCKYHSLMYFEQAKSYYDKYLSEIKMTTLDINVKKRLDKEKQIFEENINDINSGAIIFVEESLKRGEIFDESNITYEPHKTGFTYNYKKFGFLKFDKNIKQTDVIIKLILNEYEKLLAQIQISNKLTEKEAICIANILKINSSLALFDEKRQYLFTLADRCHLIIDQLNIQDKKEWCKEFLDLYKNIQLMKEDTENYNELLQRVREKNKKDFDELDNQFNKFHGKIEFIDYITKTHPYDTYEKDKNQRDFNNYNPELLIFLMKKYQPDFPTGKNDETDKKFCLFHEISSKLSNMITTRQ